MYDQFSSSKRGIILGESNVIMMSYCHFLKYFFNMIFWIYIFFLMFSTFNVTIDYFNEKLFFIKRD